MNVLVTSVGRRVSVLQYLKAEWQGIGQVIAVDASPYAPALLFADLYEVVPPIHHPDYLPMLLEICAKYQVKAVLSLIDPELSVLAANQERFAAAGVQVVVSDYAVTEMCLDKKATYQFLHQHGLPGIPTFTAMDEVEAALRDGHLQYPLLAKPRRGSASQGVERIMNHKQLNSVWEREEEMVIQPFVNGREIGIDAYVDLITGQLVSVFAKEKIVRNNGVTNVTRSLNDERVTNMVQQLVTAFRFRGPIDIDCFLDGNQLLISEINPRFGGTYPHAYKCGVNFMRLLLNNVQGYANIPQLDRYQPGMVIMNYDQTVTTNTSLLVK